jgi:hypothetical protein
MRLGRLLFDLFLLDTPLLGPSLFGLLDVREHIDNAIDESLCKIVIEFNIIFQDNFYVTVLEVVTIKHEQLAKVGLGTAGHSLLLPLLLGQRLRLNIRIDVVLQVLLIRLLNFLDCPLEVRVWYSCVRAR